MSIFKNLFDNFFKFFIPIFLKPKLYHLRLYHNLVFQTLVHEILNSNFAVVLM